MKDNKRPGMEAQNPHQERKGLGPQVEDDRRDGNGLRNGGVTT